MNEPERPQVSILFSSGFAVDPQSNLYEPSTYKVLSYPTEILAYVACDLDLTKLEL